MEQGLTASSENGIEQVTIKVLPDGRVTRSDAARYIGIKPHTLANWATVGKGPKPIKIGGRIYYRREALEAYTAEDQAALDSKSREAVAR